MRRRQGVLSRDGGKDRLVGAAGRDTLRNGAGDDRMRGGGDLIVLGNRSRVDEGCDTILDFDAVVGVLRFGAGRPASVSITEVAGGTRLTLRGRCPAVGRDGRTR